MEFQKKVFHPQPNRKPTEEEIKRRDLAWEILCKNSSVNIMDPLNIKELEHIPTGSFCDYHDSTGNKSIIECEKIMKNITIV